MPQIATSRFHPLRHRPSPAYREIPWSPAVEVEVTHERFDAPASHPYVDGLLINRHVVEGARFVSMPEFHRDYKGSDEEPGGASVSLASAPRKEGARNGGELFVEGDGRTRFQRDWDFLQKHAQRAFERYRSNQLPLIGSENYLREETELSDWRKAEALALYARNWKTRIPQHAESHHPVDALVYSYHCAGAANILWALATVSGLQARRIATSNHSMVEILIGDRWVWCDNIVSGAVIMPCSFVEVMEQLPRWPNLSQRQVEYSSAKEPWYRCPFQMDLSLSWRCSGDAGELPGSGDLAHGIGLSTSFNPATANALYPGASEHRLPAFHGEDGGARMILKEKQGWIRSEIEVSGSEALRSTFHLSACDDNPLRKGTVDVWLGKDTDPEDVTVLVDGEEAQLLGSVKARFVHPAARFALPTEALRPGTHEIVVRARTSTSARIVLYPDLIGPAEPVATEGLRFAPEPADILTDPTHEPVLP